MFVPGVADAYCSHRGHDVNVLAVLSVRPAPCAPPLPLPPPYHPPAPIPRCPDAYRAHSLAGTPHNSACGRPQDSAALNAADAERDAHVRFLRRVLEPAVRGLEGAAPELEQRGIDTWPLFDLEDLLMQCWLPNSWLRARVVEALGEVAAETGETLRNLEVRLRCCVGLLAGRFWTGASQPTRVQAAQAGPSVAPSASFSLMC